MALAAGNAGRPAVVSGGLHRRASARGRRRGCPDRTCRRKGEIARRSGRRHAAGPRPWSSESDSGHDRIRDAGSTVSTRYCGAGPRDRRRGNSRDGRGTRIHLRVGYRRPHSRPKDDIAARSPGACARIDSDHPQSRQSAAGHLRRQRLTAAGLYALSSPAGGPAPALRWKQPLPGCPLRSRRIGRATEERADGHHRAWQADTQPGVPSARSVAGALGNRRGVGYQPMALPQADAIRSAGTAACRTGPRRPDARASGPGGPSPRARWQTSALSVGTHIPHTRAHPDRCARQRSEAAATFAMEDHASQTEPSRDPARLPSAEHALPAERSGVGRSAGWPGRPVPPRTGQCRMETDHRFEGPPVNPRAERRSANRHVFPGNRQWG